MFELVPGGSDCKGDAIDISCNFLKYLVCNVIENKIYNEILLLQKMSKIN